MAINPPHGKMDQANPDLANRLRDLIDRGALGTVEEGVTRIAIENGPEALSPKQRDVFEWFVLNRHGLSG